MNRILTLRRYFPSTCCALTAAITGSASAATIIDLRPGQADSGAINGAIYAVDTTHPAGTGIFNLPGGAVFETIQEVQGNPNDDPNGLGVEEGYNTSHATVMDTDRVPQWNHELLVSDLNVVVINGVDYVPFLLDINEAAAANKSLLTLDDVQILTSPTTIGVSNLTDLLTDANATLRYWMDAGGADPGTFVVLDYNRSGSGSGEADLGLFVPLSAFAGALLTDYVYLYSRFGGDDASAVTAENTESHAGFEEWTLGTGRDITDGDLGTAPEPSSALLSLLGAGVLLLRRKR